MGLLLCLKVRTLISECKWCAFASGKKNHTKTKSSLNPFSYIWSFSILLIRAKLVLIAKINYQPRRWCCNARSAFRCGRKPPLVQEFCCKAGKPVKQHWLQTGWAGIGNLQFLLDSKVSSHQWSPLCSLAQRVPVQRIAIWLLRIGNRVNANRYCKLCFNK